MRTDLSAAHDAQRPFVAVLARSGAVALLSLLIVTCHSETATAPAVPKSLVFTVQPSSGNAVTALSPAVQVSAQDGNGHTLTSFSGPITVAIGSNPGAATLSGTKTVNAASGVAVFSSLVVNRPGSGFTLTATSTAASGVTGTSAAFAIVPGPVAQVIFNVEPTNATAGQSITPAIQATVQDAAGNTVTTFSGNVAMTIGTNPSGGTLSGTSSVAASSGVATFNNLSIDKAGTGYKLTATAGAGSGTSNAFSISAAVATQLVFSTQPTATAAGSNITPAVVVTAQDAFGNTAASFANAVTVAITGSTGKAGAALSGTTTVTAAGGTATFSTLSIDSAGTGYTLSATATGLIGGFASATFNIVPGAATQLAYTVQPSNTTAGANIAPAIVVRARDAKGNTATGFTSSVTLAIGTNAGGGSLSGTVSGNAVAGVATFATVNIDKSGIGYTLAASSGTLTGATSNAFNIIAGVATKLAFTSQPTSSLAAATINSVGGVKVSAQDALGNTDLTFTASVTVGFGNNAGSGTLSGTLSSAAVSGVATFTNLSIDKTGTGYTLAATASGVTAATSTGFNIINTTATHLVFTLQPGNTVAGATIGTVTVTALDASNNVAIDFTAAVAIGFGNNAGTGVLGGTTSASAVAGVATFSTLNINKTGTGYTLSASAGSLASATSNAFNITPGPATHLAVATQPTSATAGVAIAPAVVVNALDVNNNVATAYTANVVFAIGANPGGGTLTGTASVAAAAGVATFSNLSIDKAATGYTLHATSGSLTDVTSTTFDISPAALSQLTFSSQPVATQAGAHIAPAVAVSGEDSFGNLVTAFTGNVAVAIGTNGGSPAPGTLSGTTTVAASGGIATFSDLNINKAGSGYTLAASASGASGATSNPFDITPGAASVLAFTIQPASTTAGTVISPPITVAAQDGLGNTVPSFVGSVSMGFGTNAGSGVLSGTTSINAASGIATFSNLSIDKAGTGYTLAASAGGLTGATSGTFNITASSATKLVFLVSPPATTTAGTAIAPSVQVAAQDGLGNTDSTFVGNVAVAITGGSGKNGAHLGGTLSHAAVTGVATFAGLQIDSAGASYTLTATATSLTAGTSASFNINPGGVTQLVFGTQPTSATSGATIAPTVTVLAKDAIGNIDTSYVATVTLTLPVNPGAATPSNASVAAVAGVASFPNLSLDKTGVGFRLQAGDGSRSSAQSNTFDITPGAASKLAFLVGPTDATVNATIRPAVKVEALDGNNNLVTNFASNITVAINTGTGTLTGTTTMAAVAGVATFSTLSINTANAFTLKANSGTLTQSNSGSFNILNSVATQLIFTGQPNTTTAGTTFSLAVTARDASNQTATSFTGNVSLAITSGTGSPGSSIGGTTTVAAVAGVATFPGLHVDLTGTNYKITATAGSIPASTTSKFFTIQPGAADHLVFAVQPSNATALATMLPQVEVTAQDVLNNTATSFTGNVALAITGGTGTGGAVLAGGGSKAAVSGVATFNTLSIDLSGTGYTLDATSTLTTVTSSSFDITPAASNRLVLTSAPPGSTTAGATFSVGVTAEDAVGTTLSGFTGNVTVSITGGTGTNGAVLSGTTTVPAVAGVASFSNLSINRSGFGYKLSFTATGLSGVTTGSFQIAAGAAARVAFFTQPVTTTAGQAIPTVSVQAVDALGNLVSGFAGPVAMSILVNPAGGTLSGTTPVTASSGIANFTDLNIDKSNTSGGYQLLASSGGLASDTSTAFSINGAAADHLTFTVAPSDRTAGLAITPAVRVTAFDAFGNVASGFTDNVSIAITNGTGAGGTLSGAAPVAAVSGVATFSTLSIDKAGSGYTLSASSTVTGTTSAPFTIIPAAATKLAFIVQPANAAANATIAPPIQVAAQDGFGNTVTTFSGSASLVIGINAGGAGTVLSGTASSVAFSSGVASFSNLSINNQGNGYTLVASSSPVLTGATSSQFNITP